MDSSSEEEVYGDHDNQSCDGSGFYDGDDVNDSSLNYNEDQQNQSVVRYGEYQEQVSSSAVVPRFSNGNNDGANDVMTLNENDTSLDLSLNRMLNTAVRSQDRDHILYLANAKKKCNDLTKQKDDVMLEAICRSAILLPPSSNNFRVGDQPLTSSTFFSSYGTGPMLTSKTPCEEFNNKRIYSDNEFNNFKQSPITNETFQHIVSINPTQFIKGNLLHNAFQMLLLIRNFYKENTRVYENQDFELRAIHQRREKAHNNKNKASHTWSKLYVDLPSIDMNDVIAEDASLIDNLIRFLYHFSSNYAFYVMEGEDEQKFDNLPIKVRQSRLTALGKEFPNKKDFLQPNKLDNVDEYETVRQGHGKGASTAANLIEAHMLGSEKFLQMFQNKDLLTLPFIRKLYQWILEKFIYCLNLEVDPQELHVTVCNNNYPIIRGEKGRKMNYRTLFKHILSLLGLYEPLKDTLNVMEGFDFFHMIGIQKKLDGRRNNGKRRRSDEDNGSNKRSRKSRVRNDDDDDDDGDFNDLEHF